MRALIPFALLAACSQPDAAPTSRPATPRAGLAPGTYRVEIDGAELVYHIRGEGPVAIALSGGPGLSWEYLQMPEVERHLKIVHLEMLGTGASDRLSDPAGYSRERDAANVEALRVHLAIDKVIVLGHSYGGFVALEYALAHTDHLAGLILYSTSPMTGEEWLADVEKNMATYRDRPWFADATDAFSKIDKATSDAEVAALFRRMAPFYMHDYLGRKAEWDAYFAKAEISEARANRGTNTPYDVRPRLGSIRAPTLIIAGATDFITSPRMADILDRGIRGARLVRFDDSGHFAHVEEPARFASAIGDFVARYFARAD